MFDQLGLLNQSLLCFLLALLELAKVSTVQKQVLSLGICRLSIRKEQYVLSLSLVEMFKELKGTHRVCELNLVRVKHGGQRGKKSAVQVDFWVVRGHEQALYFLGLHVLEEIGVLFSQALV